MKVRTKTRPSLKYGLVYFFITVILIYLCILLIPGLLIDNYLKVFGTIPFIIIVFFSLRFYVFAVATLIKPKIKLVRPKKYPFVSIIVPAYNEEAVLDRTIRSMLELDYPKDRLEVLYVYESHCTDRTEEIILKYAKKDQRIVPLKRNEKKGGKAAPSNYGIRHAKGDIIGIFDADHSLNPDLVLYAVNLLRDKRAGCVRGRCRVINRNANLLTRLVAIERDVVERIGIFGAYKMGGFSNFGGGHGFFRKEVFDELGEFDEDILNEDIDFTMRLHMAGYHVVDIPQMQSWEENPTSFKVLWNQRKRWSRGWIQVWRRYILQVPSCKNMSLFKKLDTMVSLSSSVSSAVTIFIFPLLVLSLIGYTTTMLIRPVALPLWVLVTITPILTGWLVWLLDRREKDPPDILDIPMSFLLLPYIFVHFIIGWTSFLDEFVLDRPYSYVKSDRATCKKGNKKSKK